MCVFASSHNTYLVGSATSSNEVPLAPDPIGVQTDSLSDRLRLQIRNLATTTLLCTGTNGHGDILLDIINVYHYIITINYSQSHHCYITVQMQTFHDSRNTISSFK